MSDPLAALLSVAMRETTSIHWMRCLGWDVDDPDQWLSEWDGETVRHLVAMVQRTAPLREALEKFVTGEGAMATDPDGDCYFCEAEGVDFELPFHPGADPDHAGEHEPWCLVPIARAALTPAPKEADRE